MQRKSFAFLRAIVLCSLFMLMAGCSAKPINVVNEPTLVGDVEKVRKAIYLATNELGWKVKERGPNEIEATLDHLRNQIVVVGIKYDADSYSMLFEKGESLTAGEGSAPSGSASVGPSNDGTDRSRWHRNWMHNLHKRIRLYLNMASVS